MYVQFIVIIVFNIIKVHLLYNSVILYSCSWSFHINRITCINYSVQHILVDLRLKLPDKVSVLRFLNRHYLFTLIPCRLFSLFQSSGYGRTDTERNFINSSLV